MKSLSAFEKMRLDAISTTKTLGVSYLDTLQGKKERKDCHGVVCCQALRFHYMMAFALRGQAIERLFIGTSNRVCSSLCTANGRLRCRGRFIEVSTENGKCRGRRADVGGESARIRRLRCVCFSVPIISRRIMLVLF
jgi:hypothetical protein